MGAPRGGRLAAPRRRLNNHSVSETVVQRLLPNSSLTRHWEYSSNQPPQLKPNLNSCGLPPFTVSCIRHRLAPRSLLLCLVGAVDSTPIPIVNRLLVRACGDHRMCTSGSLPRHITVITQVPGQVIRENDFMTIPLLFVLMSWINAIYVVT